MSKVLFFSFPYYGHINYLLKIAGTLKKRGHDVIFVSSKQYELAAAEANVSFMECNYMKLIPVDSNDLSKGLNGLYALVDTILGVTSFYLKKDLERFQLNVDCIVYDSYAYWGKEIAEKLGVPHVCSITSHAYNRECLRLDPDKFLRLFCRESEDSELFDSNFKALFKTIDLFSRTLSRKHLSGKKEYHLLDAVCGDGHQNIVYSLKELYDSPQLFGSAYYFVGPIMESKEHTRETSSSEKIIYISLGTILDNMENFFNECIAYFSRTCYKVYMSIGRTGSERLTNVPPNFVVASTLPQVEILQQCSLFITHGGANSMNEALYCGVPMVVIPFATDEFLNAAMIERNQIGICIDNGFKDMKLIFQAAERAMMDNEMAARAKAISTSYKQLGGLSEAISIIEQTCRI